VARPAEARPRSCPDRFAQASGDFALQSDPLTQNRYAFAGGNPVNNVEFDGHRPTDVKYPKLGPRGPSSARRPPTRPPAARATPGRMRCTRPSRRRPVPPAA